MATLDIANVLPYDSAVYTCRIANRHGDATTSATLKVVGRSSTLVSPLLLDTIPTSGYESILRDPQHPLSWQKIQELERPVVQQQMDVAVMREKPHFVNTPANVDNVAEGQPLRLEASFEPARDPTMKVQW